MIPFKKIRLSTNDRIPVDCTNVVVVADDGDAAAAAASVVDDDADDKKRPFDGSLPGVTREICCSADGSCCLPKQPKPEARVNLKTLGEDASGPCQKNAL